MAYRKQCDHCRADLETTDAPYLQIHGSISEQTKDEQRNIEYRYLTPHPNTKLALCDDACVLGWLNDMRNTTPFVRRSRRVIPNNTLY